VSQLSTLLNVAIRQIIMSPFALVAQKTNQARREQHAAFEFGIEITHERMPVTAMAVLLVLKHSLQATRLYLIFASTGVFCI
jgi:hypothetical protein